MRVGPIHQQEADAVVVGVARALVGRSRSRWGGAARRARTAASSKSTRPVRRQNRACRCRSPTGDQGGFGAVEVAVATMDQGVEHRRGDRGVRAVLRSTSPSSTRGAARIRSARPSGGPERAAA